MQEPRIDEDAVALHGGENRGQGHLQILEKTRESLRFDLTHQYRAEYGDGVHASAGVFLDLFR